MRSAIAVAAAAVLVLMLGACSSEEQPVSGEPEQALADAVAALAATPSVHVVLSSENLPGSGTILVAADGTAVLPDSFQGDFEVSQSGLTVTVPVVATDDMVWAQLPLSTTWSEVDPAALGVPDPATLLDPDVGLPSLLAQATDVRADGQVRHGDQVLDVYTATIPGAAVGELLPVETESLDVAARLGVDAGSTELRLADLEGMFYAGAGQDQHYRVLLDDYGAEATVEPPAPG